MMDERLYKSYQNITNIVFRISDGTEESKSRAILLNSHMDSTLPSPGAGDDAMCVGIMLDVARVLIQSVSRENWFVGWSIIFCKSFRGSAAWGATLFRRNRTRMTLNSCTFCPVNLSLMLAIFPCSI